MPSIETSSQLAPVAMPSSPRSSSGPGTAPTRPALMKRQSSQNAHPIRHHSHPVSPGSVGEHPAPPPRHHVKPRHTKIILPRNHSSGRNLAKLGRQLSHPAPGNGDDTRRHSRQRSYEGTAEQVSQPASAAPEFRLPGSLGDQHNGAHERDDDDDEESAYHHHHHHNPRHSSTATDATTHAGGAGPTAAAQRPAHMRRNMTAYQLPRNTSHTKLKKNLSHGHLSRLSSGRTNAAGAAAAPPSPGLKGRSKRPKSMDMAALEKDLHAQEVELLEQQQQQQQQQSQRDRKDSRKKVGFAVGSAGDDGASDDSDEGLEMEGSGLQEDEWTDQSASASPYNTRQNTAANSRRPSAAENKHPLGKVDWLPPESAAEKKRKEADSDEEEEGDDEEDEEEDEDDGDDNEEDDDDDETDRDEHPSPRSLRPQQPVQPIEERQQPPAAPVQAETGASRMVGVETRDHANPTTRRLLSKSQQLPAPALLSNISALDATHSRHESPAVSLRSSRSNLAESTGDPEQDELVSCFVPSTSHPSVGSGSNTTTNTPRQGGFHTPDEDSTLAAQRRENAAVAAAAHFQVGPLSPGSTLSGSSGAATPALGRSRTELRMLQEKALADIESSAERQPTIPAHFYDRRNESLKPYLKGNVLERDAGRGSAVASARIRMGPEIFQGRFRAVNTELRVVQKFRSPVGDALSRLRACKAHKLPATGTAPIPATTGLTASKSTTSLPARRQSAHIDPSTSAAAVASVTTAASPPSSPGATLSRETAGAKSAVQLSRSVQRVGSERQRGTRREVSFARDPNTAASTREPELEAQELTPDAIARQLWADI